MCCYAPAKLTLTFVVRMEKDNIEVLSFKKLLVLHVNAGSTFPDLARAAQVFLEILCQVGLVFKQ